MSDTQCALGDTTCAPWAECYVDGFLPCSSTFLGNVFLFVIYCVIIFFASQTIFQSSSKLIHVCSLLTLSSIFNVINNNKYTLSIFLEAFK